MVNSNTIVLIILIFIIAIVTIVIMTGRDSHDGLQGPSRSPSRSSSGSPSQGTPQGTPQGAPPSQQTFRVKPGISPELQWLFESQRAAVYDLDTVCTVGECYNVRIDVEDVPETIRLLDEIDSMIEKLTYCMQIKYTTRPEVVDPVTGAVLTPAKPPKVQNAYREAITNNIIARYKRKNIIENSTGDITQTSFVTDKGRLFAICTRALQGTGKHHDLELLKFIALHELAHIANSIPGTENHGPEFWRTFKMILLEAKDNGLCTDLATETGTITYCNGLKMKDENLNLVNVVI